MQLHQLKTNKKSRKRIARGATRGNFSGQGMKGQKSRAGRKLEPPIRGLIKRYHKLRGYKKNSFKEKFKLVSIHVLSNNFNDKEIVSPSTLVAKKIVRKNSGRMPLIKILKKGELDKSLIIKNCAVSEKARIEIEKKQGEIR